MRSKRETYYQRCLRVNATAPSERLKDFDLGAEQLKFYFQLHTYRYWTTKQIVEATGADKTTVYKYIKRFEDRGLVEVDSELSVRQRRTLRWRRKYDEVRVRDWGVCWVKPVGKR